MRRKFLLSMFMLLLCLNVIGVRGLYAQSQSVAKIGEEEYETLAAAIAAANPVTGWGATVTLLKDITLEGGYTDAGEGLRIEKSVTIDGAGHTIDCGTFKKGIRIYENGEQASNVMFKNVTIVNNNAQGRCIDTRSGKINLMLNGGVNLTAHGTNSQPLTIGGSEAMTKVTITGGTIDAGTSGYGVICFVPVTNHINVQSNAEIKGLAAFYLKEGVTKTAIKLSQSTSIGTNKYATASGVFGAVVIEGSNNTVRLEHDQAVVKAVAGDGAEMAPQAAFLFSGNNNTVGYYNNADPQVITEGGQSYFVMAEANATGTKFEKNGEEMVPEAATCNYQFMTIEDALRFADDGSTVKLLADVTLSETYVNNKSLTLDLNGKTINGALNGESTTDHIYALKNYGTLTITDTSADKNGAINSRGNYNYGTLTLEAGTINAIDGNGGYAVWNQENSAFVMNGGTVAATNEDDNKVDEGGNDATTVRVEADASFTMNGGIINNVSDFTFAIDNSGTTTVKGGTITSVHTTVRNNNTMTIEDGSFTCNGVDGQTQHVIWAEAGITIINGGTFNGKDTYNGFNVTASAGATVNITGGYFLSVHSGSLYGDGTIAVSGGTFFDAVPTERCAEGYIPTENTDGTYGVEVGPFAAKVGDTKYLTIEEAIKAAAPSGTVEILSDVTVDEWIMFSETLNIGSGQIITMNINGLTINGNGKTVTINSIESAGNGDRLFYDATKLNINNWTIDYANGVAGGIGLTSGTISNVTFIGGTYGVFPGAGNVTVTGCTFKTNGTAIYFEQERDDLVVTNNTFELPADANVILLRGDVTFTGNTVVSGRTVNVVSGSPEVTDNDFNDVRFKVYNAATATIENNEINVLAFNDNSVVFSTFGVNTLSTEAQTVLDGASFPVAQIGTTKYGTLQEAFKAATSGCTIEILSNVTIDEAWDNRYTGTKFNVPVTINGNDKTIKFTASVNDNNYQAPFRFQAHATVNNLIIDMSEVTDNRFRAISSNANLTVNGCKFIGKDKTLNCRAIIFGEGAGANVGNLVISITNSEFSNWKRGITDNENAQDVKTVTITGNTLTSSAVYVSAKETVTFTGNTVSGAYVNIRSYSDENNLSVTATGNTLEGNTENNYNYIYAKNIEAQEEFVTKNPPLKVSTKAELNAAINAANDGDVIEMTADIDYGTDQLKIEKPITLDLGGKTLTTRNAYGGMSIKNNPTIMNGNIVHASNTAAIKVWNATAFEDLVIDVQGKGDANKTIGGIVLQSGSTTRVGSIKNVTIKGDALTNGIETYNCGDATENVIGSMENVNIDAVGTAMFISAPCGTATNCTFDGGVNGIEIWIKGNYSASLGLVDCDVVGGVFAHDEFSSNPEIVNNGTLNLTADEATSGAGVDDVTLTLARAEHVAGVLEDVMEQAEAKVNNTYYATLAAAINAATADANTITLLNNVDGAVTVAADDEIILDLNGKTVTSDDITISVLGGELTVVDNSTEKSGKIISTHANGNEVVAVKNNGKFTLNSGNIEGASYGVYLYKDTGGAAIINGGSITLGGAYKDGMTVAVASDKCSLTVTGGTFTANDVNYPIYSWGGTVELKGGIYDFNPNSDYIPNGYISEAVAGEEGMYQIISVQPMIHVGGESFYKLSDAFAAAGENDVITISRAGNYVWPSTAIPAGVTVKGTVDGVVATSDGETVINATTLTVENIDFTAVNRAAYVTNGKAQELTFTGCAFTGVYAFHVDAAAADAVLNFNGCQFNGFTTFATTVGTVNVAGGSVNDAFVVRQDATISDVDFSAESVIQLGTSDVVTGANLTVTNCTVDGVAATANLIAEHNVADDNGNTVVFDGDVIYGGVAKIGDERYATLAEALEEVQTSETKTIELINEAAVEGTAQIPAGVTIKSNGHTITGNIRMLGNLTLDGPLTITGGLWVGVPDAMLTATLTGDKLTASYFMFQRGTYTINADIEAVYGYLSFEGAFEVNSTITTSNTNGEPLYLNGNINLNSGAAFNIKYLYLSNENTVLKVKEGAAITATGSVSLTAAGAQLTSAGNISGTISKVDGTTISISGGTYTQAIPAEWCAEGFKPVTNENGTYSVIHEQILIAHVGIAAPRAVTTEIYVSTMDEAVAQALAAGSDYVTYKIYGEKVLTTGNSHGIIDLGKNVVIEGADESAKLTIVGGGVPDFKGVTFKNITLVDEGTYLPTANEFMYQNYIDCTFENVTFEEGIRVNGNTTITNSTINAPKANQYALWSDGGTLTMTGSTVAVGTEGYGMIKSDATGAVFNLTNNKFEYLGDANKEALNTNGAIIIASGNQFIDCTKGLLPEDKTNYSDENQAVITNEILAVNNTVIIYVAKVGDVEYQSLQAAINAVVDNTETTITLINNVTVSETVTVAAADEIILDLNGKSITPANDQVNLLINGKLTIKDGVGDGVSTFRNHWVKDGGELVVNGGTIQNIATATGGFPVNLESGAKATINGGTVQAVNSANYAVSVKSGAELTVEGGTLSGRFGTVNSAGTITINNGTFNVTEGIGGHCLYASAGTVTINNGDFNPYNTDGSATSYSVYVNGANVTINNGSFEMEIYGRALGKGDNGTLTVKGGTYTSSEEYLDSHLKAFVAEGYICVNNNDGTYTVTEDQVAKIDEVVYSTLKAAIKAAKEDETVVLIKDITENITIDNTLAITVDLNTYTVNGYFAPFAGNITVENGTINNTNSGYSAIEITSGVLVLEDVDIISARHALRVDGDVEVTINGGEYSLIPKSGMTQHVLNVSGTSELTIEDGIFTGARGNTNEACGVLNIRENCYAIVNGGTFTKGVPNTIAGTGSKTLYGGTYDQDVTDYCADGYASFANGDGTYSVLKVIAKINDVNYASLNAAIYEANEDDIVVLQVNTTEQLVVTTGKDVTVDLNGKAINYVDAAAALIDGGKLTVVDNSTEANGKIVTNKDAVSVQNGGEFTLKSGNIEGGTYIEGAIYIVNIWNGLVTIEGGSITASGDNKDVMLVAIDGGSSFVVKGGTFTANDVNYPIYSFSGTVELKGGVYDFEPYTEFIASGYTLVERNDGKYTIEGTGIFVNDVQYSTITDAFEAVGENGTVEITKPGTYTWPNQLSSVVIPAGVTVSATVDGVVATSDGINNFNATTLTVNNIDFVAIIKAAFVDSDEVKNLTFNDCSFTATATDDDGNDLYAFQVNKAADESVITFNNCSFDGFTTFGGTLGTVDVNGGNVDGGFVVRQDATIDDVVFTEKSRVQVGTIDVVDTNIILELTTCKVGDNSATVDLINYNDNLADERGNSVIIDGVVVYGGVAKIDEVRYTSLQDAIDAATAGNEIDLISDVALNSFVEVNDLTYEGTQSVALLVPAGKSITIDLNGNNIETSTEIAGTMTGDRVHVIGNLGTLNIIDSATEKGAIISNTSDANAGGFAIFNQATATLNGVTVIGNNGRSYAVVTRGANAETTFTNCTVYGRGGIAAEGGCIITVNSGLYYSNETNRSTSHAVYIANGNVTINGGTFEAKKVYNGFVVDMGSGELTINGGKFIGCYNGETINDCLYLSDNSTGTINVKGGTFNYGIVKGEGGTVIVTGGTFGTDPTAYLADGYAAFFDEASQIYYVRMISGTHTISLDKGWNWFSTYIDLTDDNGLETLQTALGKYGVQIKGKYNNNSSSYQDLGNGTSAWLGDFNLSTKQMYMININTSEDTPETVDISISGDVVNHEEVSIPVHSGWNWISYPLYESVDINEALANIENVSNEDVIKTFGKSAQYSTALGKWIGPLKTMEPGKGYMYKSANATSIIYSSGNSKSIDTDAALEDNYWDVDNIDYANNMTVIAMLTIDGEIVKDNYEIAAFANGECRGSARPIYVEELDAYLLFLTIHGEEVENLTFKFYDVNYGTEYELANTIIYSNDAVVGSIDEPYMFNLNILGMEENSIDQISIYPNPTTTNREINLQTLCDKVEVFNALGVKVAEYTNVDSIDAIETAGIYVIRATVNNEIKHCRLIVK